MEEQQRSLGEDCNPIRYGRELPERIQVPLQGHQQRRYGNLKCCDLNGERQADDHNAAFKQNRNDRNDRDLHGWSEQRDGLSVAVLRVELRRMEEQQCEFGKNGDSFRYSREIPKRIQIPLHCLEQFGQRNICGGHAYGESTCGPGNPCPAPERDSRSREHRALSHRSKRQQFDLPLAVQKQLLGLMEGLQRRRSNGSHTADRGEKLSEWLSVPLCRLERLQQCLFRAGDTDHRPSIQADHHNPAAQPFSLGGGKRRIQCLRHGQQFELSVVFQNRGWSGMDEEQRRRCADGSLFRGSTELQKRLPVPLPGFQQ